MSESLKIIFAGTPDFAAGHLAALLKTKHQVVGVLTPPDKPAGRVKADAKPCQSISTRTPNSSFSAYYAEKCR